MNYEELLERYLALIAAHKTLQQEHEILRARLSATEQRQLTSCRESACNLPLEFDFQEAPEGNHHPGLTGYADPSEKINLFMSLFRGRADVYAKRWQNRVGRFGYAPVCLNEWKSGLCKKPAVKCPNCQHKLYDALNEKVVEAHLRGNIIVGIYPLCQDETCHFLAADFDDDGWQGDISTLREVCRTFDVPVAIERSRSGNGAHAWFFFENRIAAHLARKFGSALLTHSMSKRHEISLRSYDRFFPNQDTMPKGGFGNLIALPLQKKAREQGKSVFIDENFKPYEDQWAFLGTAKRLSEDEIAELIPRLCRGHELGALKKDDEEETPWEKNRTSLSRHDFPEEVNLVKANMLFIAKAGISQRALNALKRLAAFKNPEFYKAQAMHMSTYGKPPVLSCADEITDYLCLPRGCETDVTT